MAVQVLFHLEFNQDDPEKSFDLICRNFEVDEKIIPFSRELVLGVCGKKDELDGLIGRASKNWRVGRMPRLDRCVLRLDVYEIQFLDDIPPRVSIDEALEIGKKYGGEDTARFINGVLDHIYTSLVEGTLEEKKDAG